MSLSKLLLGANIALPLEPGTEPRSRSQTFTTNSRASLSKPAASLETMSIYGIPAGNKRRFHLLGTDQYDWRADLFRV